MRLFKFFITTAIAVIGIFYFWPESSTGQESNPAIIFGCKNTQGISQCLDLGSQNENPSGVTFHKRAKNSTTNAYATFDFSINDFFTQNQADSNYKNYSPAATAPAGYSSGTNYISFNAFGQLDEKGFPIEEYLLEIHYKDVYRNDSGNDSGWKYDKRVFIESLINYGSPNQYFIEVGKLLGTGSNTDKYEQIYFPKNSWQRIRSVDGKFSFSLKDLREDRTVPLPIDYIALKRLSSEEAKRFSSWQENNALQYIAETSSKTPASRVEYIEKNPQPNISNFKWFSVATMKPIYPNQYPLESEIEKPITISSAYDEIEPFNFGIFTKQKLDNVSFVLSDLSLKTDPGVKLAKDKISIKKVIYGVKFWGSRLGNIGLQPDYPIDFSTTSIPENSSQQFWGEVRVDKGIPAGEYSGKVGLKIGGGIVKDIPLTVKVLPIVLSESDRITAIYQDPAMPGSNGSESFKLWGTEQAIKQDMVENGISNIIGSLQVTVPVGCGTLTEQNYKAFKDRFLQLKREGLIGKTAVYKMSPAWGAALGCTPQTDDWWVRYRDPLFINKFKEILTEVKRFVESNGSDIILIGEDEPQKLADRNMQVMVTSKIAHDVGIKVWSTYSATASSEKACRRDLDPGTGYNWRYCEPCNNLDTDFCYKKDGVSYLPGLSNYVDYKAWAMGSIDSISGQVDRTAEGFKETFGYYTTGLLQTRNPIINRFLNSYYAENAEGDGAKIIANWAYVGETGSDPYNDFDQMPRYGSKRIRPDYLLSYPSWDGNPIPTFAMKGLREGIKDAKYIATLRKLIAASPNDQTAREARAFLDSTLDDNHVKTKFTSDYTSGAPNGYFGSITKYLSGGANATEANLDDYEIFDNNRKKMIDLIEAFKKPSISVSANKTETWRGDEIIYSVEMNNPTATQIQNANIKVPIPQGTQYQNASATEGAVLEGNNLKWVKNIQAGQKFRATFKVRVN